MHTSSGEGFAVEVLVMHSRFIGEDVAVLVVTVPATTMRAEEGERLFRWRGNEGLAEKAESARLAKEECTHDACGGPLTSSCHSHQHPQLHVAISSYSRLSSLLRSSSIPSARTYFASLTDSSRSSRMMSLSPLLYSSACGKSRGGLICTLKYSMLAHAIST